MSIFKRLAEDRSGNFGIMTAILLPVLLGAAGIAIDVTSTIEQKGRIQASADAAALAAATAMANDTDGMTNAEAEAMAKAYFIDQAVQGSAAANASEADLAALKAKVALGTTATATTTKKSNTAESYDVRVNSNYTLPVNGMTSILGMKTIQVAVSSYAHSGREGNALSMYLVLDESGSMAYDTTTVDPANPTKEESYDCSTWWKKKTCTKTVANYITKMASLKAAAATMFAELKKADPGTELIRVGADSYDDETKTAEAISWGTTKVETYVGKLPEPPAGGTDASGAMTNALNALKVDNATEKNAHKAKNNTSFARAIVFMTDGEMTGNSNEWNQSIHNKVLKLCTDAKANKDANGNAIQIYTIAFMAPENGKSLLNACATDKNHYYEPNDMSSLVQTFSDIARKAASTGTRLTQ
jgi:Flp pilus assembly protein TadG